MKLCTSRLATGWNMAAASVGVLGLPLMRLLPRNPKFREIIRSYQKE